MKQIYILTFILFSLTSYSQNCNIGNESTDSNFVDGNFGANFLLGVKYTLNQEGTLNSINYIGNGTGEGIQMAVYNDNSGVPNNLIASSLQSNVESGFTTLPVAPVLLPPGDYWIMAVYQNGGNSSNYNPNATGNVVYYQSLIYGNTIPTNASGFSGYFGQDFLYSLSIDCGNTLSIDDLNFENKFSLSPNPSSDFISVSNLKSKESYLIVNQLGQKVKKGIISNNEQIDIRNFTHGIYFLIFDNGNTIKFIKQQPNK